MSQILNYQLHFVVIWLIITRYAIVINSCLLSSNIISVNNVFNIILNVEKTSALTARADRSSEFQTRFCAKSVSLTQGVHCTAIEIFSLNNGVMERPCTQMWKMSHVVECTLPASIK